jgi:pimeloyl-ACP methyl ester carboxylesterase
MSTLYRGALLCTLAITLIRAFAGIANAQQHITGTLADGATYVIDVPANWNKKLLLYSHGYVAPGSPNPAYDYGDFDSAYFLFIEGYALAGSSYATTGWAVQQAIPDQIATLDAFQSTVGTPTETIAWGHSLGGMITAALVQQYPNRFNGALPMCGVVAGGVGFWNEALDAAFAFNTLLAGGSLQVVNITNPLQNYDDAESILGAAQGTPQGQARIALAAALADVPGWFDPSTPQPAPTDYVTQEANQFAWFANDDFLFPFYLRTELEQRAGGNPSFNTGVNYKQQLTRSANYAEVQALYAAAHLSLSADLAALQNARRISADPAALTYLSDNIIYDGKLTLPVLTLHTIGDGLVPVEAEKAYQTVVREAKDISLLQQAFIHRAGHCVFTPAEMIAAVQTLDSRITSGKWKNITVANWNNEASALGPAYNVLDISNTLVETPPAFWQFEPMQFLRIYDSFTH